MIKIEPKRRKTRIVFIFLICITTLQLLHTPISATEPSDRERIRALIGLIIYFTNNHFKADPDYQKFIDPDIETINVGIVEAIGPARVDANIDGVVRILHEAVENDHITLDDISPQGIAPSILGSLLLIMEYYEQNKSETYNPFTPIDSAVVDVSDIYLKIEKILAKLLAFPGLVTIISSTPDFFLPFSKRLASYALRAGVDEYTAYDLLIPLRGMSNSMIREAVYQNIFTEGLSDEGQCGGAIYIFLKTWSLGNQALFQLLSSKVRTGSLSEIRGAIEIGIYFIELNGVTDEPAVGQIIALANSAFKRLTSDLERLLKTGETSAAEIEKRYPIIQRSLGVFSAVIQLQPEHTEALAALYEIREWALNEQESRRYPDDFVNKVDDAITGNRLEFILSNLDPKSSSLILKEMRKLTDRQKAIVESYIRDLYQRGDPTLRIKLFKLFRFLAAASAVLCPFIFLPLF